MYRLRKVMGFPVWKNEENSINMPIIKIKNNPYMSAYRVIPAGKMHGETVLTNGLQILIL